MAHEVLMSYSSKDKLQADAICNRLESQGIRCWIAPRDVPLGTEYAESIVQAIETAKVLVLVFSANADESHQVRREVERAVSKGVTIIPVRIEDTEMSKSLELYVSSMHWLDAISPPLEQHIDKLAKDLKALLAKEEASESGEKQEASSAKSKATSPRAAPTPASPTQPPAATPGAGSKSRPGIIGIAAVVILLGAVALWWFQIRDGVGVASGITTASIVAGNNQSIVRSGDDVPAGTAVFAPLVANFKSSSGTPLSRVPIEFRTMSVPSNMAAQMNPVTAEEFTVVQTDLSGNATLDLMGSSSVHAYYDQGAFQISATAEDGTQVVFNLTVAPSPARHAPVPDAVMSIVSGDSQTASRQGTELEGGEALFEPLVVHLETRSGTPLVGIEVDFAVKSKPRQMAVQLEPAGVPPCIVKTDSNGNATLDKMNGSSVSAYYGDGVAVISATHGTAEVLFTLRVTPQ